MAKSKLITRSQAAELLNKLDKVKSVSQWHTFLNDNTKPSVKTENRIPFEKTANNISMYHIDNIEGFIAKRKAEAKARKEQSARPTRVDTLRQAYGFEEKENQNTVGQVFGYKWKGASVNLIADNAERGQPHAVSIQLQINHPLRVSALTTAEAEAFAKELMQAVERAKALNL